MAGKVTLFAIVLTLAGAWAASGMSQWGGGAPIDLPDLKAPVVVELFTSQSCSSCPPADEVLQELNQHDNIIALGCHVTYWDHLDWKDTLSQPFCTQRQRAYAAARGTGQIYTPQMVVNGHVEFVGSNRSKAVREIEKAAKAGAPRALKPIAVTRPGPATLAVTLPQLDQAQLAPGASPQTLWLLAYRNKHTQSMRAGENRGRTVAYVNPVSALIPLDDWNGQAVTRTYPLPAALTHLPETDGFVILAQSPPTGPITAAGKVSVSAH